MLRPLLTIELSCDRFDPDTPVELELLLVVVVVVATGAVGVATGATVSVVVVTTFGAVGSFSSTFFAAWAL